jgi:acetolactate synthase-1/2/3 large subunit
MPTPPGWPVADTGVAIADLLADGGVRHFFCVPGESFLEVIDGVDRHPDLRLVSTRHESGAAFMGEASAKVSGRPAVVAGTRGVGAANLAIGVHTAYQDSTPMVVMLGQADTGFLGREAFQEVDLPDFYRQITKWSVTAHRTDRIPELVAEALRVAQSGRPGPTMIAFPADVLAGDIPAAAVTAGRRRVAMHLRPPGVRQEDCAQVAARLAAAQRPVIIAGAGARGCRAELIDVAERFQAGVYAAFRRQDVFPNDHDLYLGHLGLGVAGVRLTALTGADLVLVLGSRLSEITTSGYRLPSPDSDIVQVDVDAGVIGAQAPVSLGLVADVGAVLRGMLVDPPDVGRRDWSSARRAFLDAATVPPNRSAAGIDPAQVIDALAKTLPADAVIANDAGNFAAFLHQHWLYRAPHTEVAPTSGAMGYGVPAAIGAKLARPDRTVVGLAGDGGFSMTAMELETAVRENVGVMIVVMTNGLQGTIAMHQARHSGRLAGVTISPYQVPLLAQSLGAYGVAVTEPDELVDVFAETHRMPGVKVVEVRTDPEILSPSATLSGLLGRHGSDAGATLGGGSGGG